MVAIKNFGATGRGAGKFLRGRLRFGPEIGKKRGGPPVHTSRGDASVGTRFWEVTVEHVPEGVAHREVIRWQDIPAAEEVLGIVRWSRS
jgi:hypothetical protein